MPSAAKRRKAIKKKKEKEAKQISANPHHPLRNDDSGSHDERESNDVVSSPSSPDHEKNDESLGESAKEVSENAEVSGKSGVEAEGSITIQHEPKTDQNIEIAYSASSSSSSSSSSDDESHEIEKATENVSNQDLVVEPIQHSDLVKPAISLPENTEEVAVNVPLPDTTANLAIETAPIDNVPLISETEDQTSVEVLAENSPKVSDDDKPVSNEKEERLAEVSGNLVMVKDLLNSDKKLEASSTVTEVVLKEYEEATLTLSDAAGESTNTAENVEEPRISESTNEPALNVAKRTSWLSCCGLFDVVAGSGR